MLEQCCHIMLSYPPYTVLFLIFMSGSQWGEWLRSSYLQIRQLYSLLISSICGPWIKYLFSPVFHTFALKFIPVLSGLILIPNKVSATAQVTRIHAQHSSIISALPHCPFPVSSYDTLWHLLFTPKTLYINRGKVDVCIQYMCHNYSRRLWKERFLGPMGVSLNRNF